MTEQDSSNQALGDEGQIDGAGNAAAPPETRPDWRVRFAGEDRSFLKRLSRFEDEAAFAKSYRSLEQKLSVGDFIKALPPDATDAERAVWRTQNNLPETPQSYLDALALPDGLVLGEADRAVAERFAERAFLRNWSAAQFNDAVGWYYENLDAEKAARDDADFGFRQQSEADLREAWPGAEYRRNLAAVTNLLATWPEGLATRMLAGRTPEGRLLGDDPSFVRQLAELARELNPRATLVPATASDRGPSVQQRIGELVAMSGDRNSDYWKGPKSDALQQELRDLNTQMESKGR